MSSKNRVAKNASLGFTVVELIVVMVCLGLLSGGAIGVVAHLRETRALSALSEIDNMISYGVEYSRSRHTPVIVSFNAGSCALGTPEGPLGDPASGLPLIVPLTKYGLDLVSAKFNGKTHLRIDEGGILQSGGEVKVRDPNGTDHLLKVHSTGLAEWSHP